MHNPAKELREKIRRERIQAFQKLSYLRKKKVLLPRPVFFIPGWRGEDCATWCKREVKAVSGNLSIREAVEAVFKNKQFVTYIKFTTKESSQCESFLDFGNIVRERVFDKIGRNK